MPNPEPPPQRPAAAHPSGVWPRLPRTATWHAMARRRSLVHAGIDLAAWGAAIVVAVLLRFEFDLDAVGRWELLPAIGLVWGLHLVFAITTGLYQNRWRYGSFESVAGLVRVLMATTAVFAAVNRFVAEPRLVPVSVSLAMFGMALLATATVRYVWRLVIERALRPSAEGSEAVIVLGAGEAGAQVVDAMLRAPDSPYRPVALLDDDPDKRRLRIRGLPVEGGTGDLASVVDRYGARRLVVAIPSATAEVLRRISDIALDLQLEIAVLPPVRELFAGAVGLADLRPLTEADLLGRRAIDTDVEAIAGYLTGRRVLVTGAGGSIGSELCRQINRFGPDELILLDRDESALHALELSLHGRALLDDPCSVVADIRDRERLVEVFAAHAPDVVFHAAALKHLPLLEMHPDEAYKTNVVGTLNVLAAAQLTGVGRFVNVSTDKAADPTSVLGYSKRIAERLTAWFGAQGPGTYLSVRFGNVLGSRGSVLTTFEAQVAAGGPLTVTDPEVSRYFMTVEEAVQLVIQAGAIGSGGQALVLDMGEPVRIADVARRLAERADRPIEIVYTGLRPGEKLHEVLLGPGEVDRRPRHPLISHVDVPALSPSEADRVTLGTGDAVARAFRRLCEVGDAGTRAGS